MMIMMGGGNNEYLEVNFLFTYNNVSVNKTCLTLGFLYVDTNCIIIVMVYQVFVFSENHLNLFTFKIKYDKNVSNR